MASASVEEITKELQRSEGNLRQAAKRLGISREWLHALVVRNGLWPVVNKAREERVKGTQRNELISRARRVLKG
jgi:hypothetical protein